VVGLSAKWVDVPSRDEALGVIGVSGMTSLSFLNECIKKDYMGNRISNKGDK
jgi:hypothetical protein